MTCVHEPACSSSYRAARARAPRFFTSCRPNRQTGFTFVELVMVVLIVGVLSVSVVPRMFNAAEFRDRGFSDEVRAALRLAQKSAVAANCPVTFTTTAGAGGGYSATYTAACPGGPTPVPSPKGDPAGLSGTVPDGMAFSAAIAITFSGSGTTGGGAVTLNGTDILTMNVSSTGYVQ